MEPIDSSTTNDGGKLSSSDSAISENTDNKRRLSICMIDTIHCLEGKLKEAEIGDVIQWRSMTMDFKEGFLGL